MCIRDRCVGDIGIPSYEFFWSPIFGRGTSVPRTDREHPLWGTRNGRLGRPSVSLITYEFPQRLCGTSLCVSYEFLVLCARVFWVELCVRILQLINLLIESTDIY